MYEQLKLDNQLCFRLYTAARLVIQAYYPHLEPLGITYPQYLVLMVLWERDHQPVNDIAKRLFLETNTITPLLQRMERQGLIERHKGDTDSRQRIVSLTPKGKEMEEQAKSIPDCLANDIMCAIPQYADLPQMVMLLDQLIHGLHQHSTTPKKQ